MTRPCTTCGAPITRRPSAFTSSTTAFCCGRCYGAWRRLELRGDKLSFWKGGLKGRLCAECGAEFFVRPTVIQECCSVKCGSIRRSRSRRGERSPRWKGGRIEVLGRTLVRAVGHPRAQPSRAYAFEHVLVAERALGRPIARHEVVHHINGDKRDNRAENLVVLSSQGEHAIVHARARIIDAGGDPDTQKLCSGCRTLQPRSAFNRDRSHWDQQSIYCRPCESQRQRRNRMRKRG